MISSKLQENRCLIVDGMPFGRDSLRRTLLTAGFYQVDIAVTGNVAIDMCKKTPYDLLIAEYDLGDGKNGQQLLEELRSNKILPNTSGFIMTSAANNREVVLSSLELQPDDYLIKPYQNSELLKRIKRLLAYKCALHGVFKVIDEGDNEAAIETIENTIRNLTDHLVACQRLLGELYLRQGNTDRAEQLYQREYSITGSDWSCLGLARAHRLKHRYGMAEQLCRELLQKNYLYIEAHEELAQVYLDQEIFPQAGQQLAKTINLSPLSVHRQKNHALMCERNNHHLAALDSWREVVRLSENTQHDNVANYLQLSRCIVDYCEYNEAFDNHQLTAEAHEHIVAIRMRYHAQGDDQLQSLLIESRVLWGEENYPEAKQQLTKASKLYQQQSGLNSVASQLEYSKSLRISGDQQGARTVLRNLVEQHDDVEVLLAADRILDEPVSEVGKRKIIALNREGIRCFKQKDYEEAVTIFNRAQICFPRNIQLNLNLLQSLLQLVPALEDQEQQHYWLQRGEQCLLQLRNISPTHSKYQKAQRLGLETDILRQRLTGGNESDGFTLSHYPLR